MRRNDSDCDQKPNERREHPIIFLDIDGVLITARSRTTADQRCVSALNRLIARSGAVIVVTSTRRRAGAAYMKRELRRWGVNAQVVGITPDLSHQESGVWHSVQRGTEIRAWLDQNERSDADFVILDDDSDVELFAAHLVQTDPCEGFCARLLPMALQRLKPGRPAEPST